MKLQAKIAVSLGALALMVAPSSAMAEHREGEPHGQGKAKGHNGKAKAYGRHCQGESKKHEKGQKGTDFSRCVRNMAQAANHKAMAPGRVCKGESKKHEKGEKGTEFSRCVHDVVKLRQEERKKAREKRKEEREEEKEAVA